jgi:Tfp pilus assembly protein PilO
MKILKTEKKGLKKREKMLMIICAFFGIPVIFMSYVITPLINDIAEKEDAYEILRTERMNVDLALLGEIPARQEYEDIIATIDEAMQRYPVFMSNADIGANLTDLSNRNGMELDGLTPPEEKSSNQIITTVSATAQLKGSFDSFKRFINAVEQSDYVRIVSTTFAVDQNASQAVFSNVGVVLEVTMMSEGV